MQEVATVAGGCFWCMETIFKRLQGVESVVSGYTGGTVAHPTYEQVSLGKTGHAEAVQITFDPAVISYQKLVDVFWHLHDPTTPNQQGADIGPQYRSIIFYHDDKQRRIAEESKKRIEQSGMYKNQIATEIVPYTTFYPAEEYHQNFYEQHASASYCRIVIDPKLRKLMKEFREDLKPEQQ